ncbi:bifunctional diguanylate cyclase/phosphodiesterase [Aliiglaciecola sp. LCG003]|uniref:putative bifunctional diguanylate cyclase/phosphodiesterase n=1 Tax=Aliiglaciecola sp. LCG003 TaxID=3053655 RepID=UPI0025745BBA|nr:bifunctional diguanylate cyclase/phosphodiesterase [Aliiglaciecola sp. LCG003]WJG08138.1 bifunctional diguanylate cyclase/phosphodiesterase [Aliiglaciecola sp. LCG003]
MFVFAIGISAMLLVANYHLQHSSLLLGTSSQAQVQQIQQNLTLQKSLLDSYSNAFNIDHFQQTFTISSQQTVASITELSHQLGPSQPLAKLAQIQQSIHLQAIELSANIPQAQSNQLAPPLGISQIVQIQQEISSAKKLLNSIGIDKQQLSGDIGLLQYAIFLILIFILAAVLLGWFFKRTLSTCLLSAQQNTDVSMFQHRTPNPIISLNEQGEVIYSNPATYRLLTTLDLGPNDVRSLLCMDLSRYQRAALQNNKKFTRFEYQLKQYTYECELHWLTDQRRWDLHLLDVSAKKVAEQRLQSQAYHHPETELANQYRFREVIEYMVIEHKPFTLGQIEIRSFSKLLADVSHTRSQMVIIELAKVLQQACLDVEPHIRCFHIGDKNFAIIIDSTPDPTLAEHFVKHLNQQMKATQFSGQYRLELDFGFATFPGDGASVEAVIRNARIALDASASQQHTDYILYSEELGDAIARKNELQVAMRDALLAQQFQLYFQPQLNLQTNKITGAEALIRWHREDQWISPAEFIPLAEQSDLILALGEWALNTACQKAKDIVNAGYTDFVIAVNISPKQFTAPGFVSTITSALTKHTLPGSNLELEITEGVLFNNDTNTLDTLRQLKQMGVKLAIDDFGTGYSSLSYLKDFPIDKLKIDQSFIKNMHNSKEDQSIARTVVDLAKNLNLSIIAEGVEERDQVNILRQMGCNHIQGNWFSKPLEEGYFSYFLQNSTTPKNIV